MANNLRCAVPGDKTQPTQKTGIKTTMRMGSPVRSGERCLGRLAVFCKKVARTKKKEHSPCVRQRTNGTDGEGITGEHR